MAENKLFATLDPTTRRVRLAGGQESMLTDTVGFVQRLPTILVAAFRATLEEVARPIYWFTWLMPHTPTFIIKSRQSSRCLRRLVLVAFQWS